MRNSYLITMIALLVLAMASCGPNKELQEERKDWEFPDWGQKFKDRTLCLCVLQGLNNTSIQDSIKKYDKSFYNPLAIAIFDSKINELLVREIRNMQIDSAKSIGRYPEDIRSLLEGKRVMNHCLELYRSKRLDSVIYHEKKEWEKIPNIMDKIHERLPTY